MGYRYISNAIGAKGEFDATAYLKKKKYKILEKNYKNKLGEIDIIAKDKDYLVFVEVKTRSSQFFGRPSEAVTPTKQHKVRMAAQFYLKDKKLYDQPCRFDVIEVLDGEINHIENAF